MRQTQHHMRNAALGALALATVALCPGAAKAVVLTFDAADACGVACTNSAFISQTYGDTALVDVRFDGDVINAGFENMRWWGAGYSDLFGVAFVGLGFGQAQPTGVHLIPISGYQITLNSFDLGSWQGAGYNTQVTLRGGDGSLISSTGTFLSNGAMRNSFTPGLTRADGFRIVFGPDNFNIGIDNINYTVSQIGGGPVPEPSAWALTILGFGTVGAMLRRRGKAVTL